MQNSDANKISISAENNVASWSRYEPYFALLAAVIIWWIYFATNFHGLSAPDAMDYSTVARNILDGKGMRMDSISWVHLLSSPADPFRVIVKSFLYPIVLLPFFALFGTSESVTAISSGLFFIVAAPFLFILARDLFGRNAAWGTVAVYLVSRELLDFSISGLTESLFILLITLELLIILRSNKNLDLFIAGLTLGLARLLRVNAVVLVPPILVYIWLVRENKTKECLVFLAGFLLAALPLMVRDTFLFGDPIFGWVHMAATWPSGATPVAETAQVHSLIEAIGYILANIVPFSKRYLINVMGYHQQVLSMTKFPVMALFLVGLLRWGQNPRGDGLRLLVTGAMIIQLMLLSAYTNALRIRYFQVFNPFIIMFAAAFFFDLWTSFARKKKWLRRFFIVLIMLYIFMPYLQSVTTSNASGDKSEFNRDLRELVIQSTAFINPKGVVMTDVPWLMAWVGERRALFLPNSIEDYQFLAKNYIHVDYILLTSSMGGGQISRGISMSDWQRLLKDQPASFNGKSYLATFQKGNMYAVLYGP